MLPGGPDMRHLFPPAFDANPASFGYNFWQAKASAHAIGSTAADFEARWENDYFQVADGNVVFGIRNNCGWLKQMWDAGNVALICNAFGATSRDHSHAIAVMDQGNPGHGPNDSFGPGWGGRLASAAGGNVLSLTPSPRPFAFGEDPADPGRIDNTRLISAKDTRQMTLHRPANGPLELDARITRSLSSYYAAKRNELSADSLFSRFVDLERKLREFGEPLDERLDATPVPASIDALMMGGLASPGFALQMRTASMDYGGWGSHRNQVGLIEPKMQDMFGSGYAFDVLYQELPGDAVDNLVFVVAGEFGRQLRANGDAGTDHGVGNVMIVFGNSVNGGVYGEMFPDTELARLNDRSPDITGLTQLDHVFGAAADWVAPGSAPGIFPNIGAAPIENGVDLSGLFA